MWLHQGIMMRDHLQHPPLHLDLGGMFGSTACTYSAGKPTRCLEALLGDKERARFLLGTTALQSSNHLHVLEYDSGGNELQRRRLYAHPEQVLDVAPSPWDPALVITCGKAPGETPEATLWRMDGLEEAHDEGNGDGPQTAGSDGHAQPLTTLAMVPTQATPPARVVWRPGGSAAQSRVASAHGLSLCLWDLADAASSAFAAVDRIDAAGGQAEPVAGASIRAVQWDPHHGAALAFAAGTTVQTWDTRAAAKVSTNIDDAHLESVLSLDYNPNKPHTLVSGGGDGRIKFWDLRRPGKPLLALSAHTHWVWSVRYNRFHDQLVLSSSSDATLALWRVSSISSAPIVELDEQDLMNEAAAGNDVVDSRIKAYEEHEDSVYATAWGVSDSWIFASASYDGRVVVNQVPSTEKYKILL